MPNAEPSHHRRYGVAGRPAGCIPCVVRRMCRQIHWGPAMHIRLKKLIGTIVTVVFLTFYCLFVMVLAVRLLPGTSGAVQFLFYLVFGLVWVIPIGLLIRWMQRPA